MAKSALQKMFDDGIRAFDKERDPKAVKVRQRNSSAARRDVNMLKRFPKHVLLKEVLRKEMAEKARKDKTAKQRERREELRQKKVLHSPAD